MKTTLISKENNIAKFTMEFTAEEFDAAIVKAYQNTKDRYTVDGFRKGKAPRKVIEARYGEGVFFEDAVNDMFAEGYPQALDELSLEVLEQPKADFTDLAHGKGYTVTIEVETYPEVTVKDYKGVEIEKVAHEVTDEDVNNEIEAVRKELPVLPNELKMKYRETGMSELAMNTVIANPELCAWLENLFTKVKFNLQSTKNLTVTKTENALKIRANNNASMTLLPSEDLKDKILFITFKNKFNRGCHGGKDDQTITINNITNKLTCRDWKYHNQNYVFHYVLTSPEKLVITFSKAYYKLGNIKVLAFPKEVLEKEKENMIPASIKKINQDNIKAKVTVDEKRTVNIAIPYDKGFKITVDGKKIAYKESIQNTITFKMDKGTHQIAISYEAPWKKLGIIISMIGILIFIYQIRKEKSCNK